MFKRGLLAVTAVIAGMAATPGSSAAQGPEPAFVERANTALAELRHARFVVSYAQWSELAAQLPSVSDPIARFWFHYNAATSACYSGARADAAQWAKAALATAAALRESLGPGAIIEGVPGHDFSTLQQEMAIVRDGGGGTTPFWPGGEAFSAQGKLVELIRNGKLDEGTYTDASLAIIRGPVISGSFRHRYESRRLNPLTGWGGNSGPSCLQGTSAFQVPAVLRVSKRRGVTIRLTCDWAVMCRTWVRLQRVAGGRYVNVAGGNAVISPGQTRSVRLSLTRSATKYLVNGGRYRLIAIGTLVGTEKYNPTSARQQAVRVQG